jgi:hypothetical protein
VAVAAVEPGFVDTPMVDKVGCLSPVVSCAVLYTMNDRAPAVLIGRAHLPLRRACEALDDMVTRRPDLCDDSCALRRRPRPRTRGCRRSTACCTTGRGQLLSWSHPSCLSLLGCISLRKVEGICVGCDEPEGEEEERYCRAPTVDTSSSSFLIDVDRDHEMPPLVITLAFLWRPSCQVPALQDRGVDEPGGGCLATGQRCGQGPHQPLPQDTVRRIWRTSWEAVGPNGSPRLPYKAFRLVYCGS